MLQIGVDFIIECLAVDAGSASARTRRVPALNHEILHQTKPSIREKQASTVPDISDMKKILSVPHSVADPRCLSQIPEPNSFIPDRILAPGVKRHWIPDPDPDSHHWSDKPKCAARAFYNCPAIISLRPRSQNISKEAQLILRKIQE